MEKIPLPILVFVVDEFHPRELFLRDGRFPPFKHAIQLIHEHNHGEFKEVELSTIWLVALYSFENVRHGPDPRSCRQGRGTKAESQLP